MTRRPWLAATLVTLLVFGPVAPALAVGCQKTSLSGIEDQVMCLACGTPLAVADSPQAEGERRMINSLIVQCQSQSQIKDALVAQYGPNVLALPPARGGNLPIYIVPIVAAIAALLGIGFAVVRWRKRGAGAWPVEPHAEEIASADEDARLDEQLARFDG
jgi:cytochrome c-type biogenesis protein CcmH